MRFAETLEQVCIQSVEEGKMTKDLAVCLKGAKVEAKDYLSTTAFIDALGVALKAALEK